MMHHPRWYRLLLAAVALVAVAASSRFALAEDPANSRWKLAWSDEFSGDEIDPKKWDFDLGNGFFNYTANVWISGWGNNEMQYYTGERENAFVDDGLLHIRVRKESLHGCGFTSARMRTSQRDGSPLFNQKYGRFEFRAKLPTGQGIWPAIWMLPQSPTYGSWAASGEIDILEVRGQEPTKVLGTLHFGSQWPADAHASREYTLPDKQTVADFHVYALEWEPGEIRWYVDDKKYATQNSWWSSSKTKSNQGEKPTSEADLNPWPAPFNQPFYLIMNVAVGGNFVGKPDSSTEFPAEMLVDYVRVYESSTPYGETPARGPGELPFGK